MTTVEAAVRKSVTVKASVERAFEVFTEGFDTWWPRSHHIGKSPMTKGIIEGFPGGRCYSEQADGTDCPWGEIVAWEPPRRLVIAWKISPQWQYQPDPAKSSEVEITFTPEPDGSTRVDLGHRHFERMGEGWENMRQQVDSDKMGWSDLLEMYAAAVLKS
jgi:uncharacterized protein YndB with AHSA1/START domain